MINNHLKISCTGLFVMLALMLIIFCSCYNDYVGECYDNDGDHLCDYCQSTVTSCPYDIYKDHRCDICKKKFGDCYDDDGNHVCDYCGLPMMDCEDNNKDHKCDYCNISLSSCTDENKDHFCDYCTKKTGSCKDADKNHLCDICNKETSDCEDGDRDHLCDVCHKRFSYCVDDSRDHLCDYCLEEISTCPIGSGVDRCPICDNFVPVIKISALGDCLINSQKELLLYKNYPVMEIQPIYVGGGEVAYWQIYDSEGNPYARVEVGEIFLLSDYGIYTIEAILQ